ncbi:MAG: hypothetical protein ACMUIA_12195 [bacterium]
MHIISRKLSIADGGKNSRRKSGGDTACSKEELSRDKAAIFQETIHVLDLITERGIHKKKQGGNPPCLFSICGGCWGQLHHWPENPPCLFYTGPAD